MSQVSHREQVAIGPESKTWVPPRDEPGFPMEAPEQTENDDRNWMD